MSRIWTVLLCLVIMACQPKDEKDKLKDELERLEKSGELPSLDRSTDLQGPDQDNDGVRDDIEKYIDGLSITPMQKQAARQVSKASRKILGANLSDPAVVEQSRRDLTDGIYCVYRNFPKQFKAAEDLLVSLKAVHLNTKERILKSFEFDEKLSGGAFRMPKGNTCSAEVGQ